MKPGRAIFTKNGGGGDGFVNNGKFPVDGDDAVMIPFVTPKERNLSRLWDSSAFALKDAIEVWRVYQSLQSEIDVQSNKISELRRTLETFGKTPDVDEDFKQICLMREEMIRSHAVLRKCLEDAYLAKCKFEATPGRKDYREQHRRALEDGVREASAIADRFKEMRLNK